MITIKDLAKIAGVSPTTVSNVLNGRFQKVSDETLTRVQAVIEETNYVSNMGGRLLANHGSRIIGVIINYNRSRLELSIAQTPFHSELIGFLEESIRNNNYYMMLHTSMNYEESVRMACAWNVEGLIVLGGNANEIEAFLQATDIPVVFIDSYANPKLPNYYNVGLADFEGARLMTSYLIDAGFKRIGFLADMVVPDGVDAERLKGFKRAYQEHKLTCQPNYFIPIDYRKTIRHQMLEQFINNDLSKYDALFFASDYYAVDTMNLFLDAGIKVPEQISITGFDNNILSEQSRPRLTTVSQNILEKGQTAVEMLLKIIRAEKIAKSNIALPVKLIERQSVATAERKSDN
ncbi:MULTISPECIES: LacI family DNA-binding transcriptional regulator [unclassified Enterococcus]|uniref:LacI family DNA-binding transcriptional regulator n=1 Tax=unclassified Enterococcus TaxID=2608891 RepID=UPI001551DF0E|nr:MULTISPECIES: LacI family DNA-binding transcriptional regulator [unclassified Enterococcus]MBS7577370.1 LacI family DNA-binding transcriptional regulator [Enterococcus sp. MMGLQ5-2]MBS7584777.1 LacI family DNA-binding transcriptional regulator [Enterococcus sp. MMGLQ5-1]NPD12632.1 LacI family DNA-binding transcriptional regulator [Enterococcus sp. MMGLQ5-1]NPD37204.1 LacI family DNA-binding transcriptional regulator [Enterococcus sp. MMGLQ5-2]